jgi:hypothetical protein
MSPCPSNQSTTPASHCTSRHSARINAGATPSIGRPSVHKRRMSAGPGERLDDHIESDRLIEQPLVRRDGLLERLMPARRTRRRMNGLLIPGSPDHRRTSKWRMGAGQSQQPPFMDAAHEHYHPPACLPGGCPGRRSWLTCKDVQDRHGAPQPPPAQVGATLPLAMGRHIADRRILRSCHAGGSFIKQTPA